jgi:NADH dehydrogenase
LSPAAARSFAMSPVITAPGSLPKIVIVGAGFGGLAAAQALKEAKAEITVIDRRNFHLFQPLLYQVATAALSPADISAPIRSVLRDQANARVMLDKVTGVDRERRLVLTEGGRSVPFDYLVVATGARHSYFGRDADWAAFAPGIKTLDDATRLRARILLAFEKAELEPDPERRRALLTFLVIGAGPTGVELAGALGEIGLHTLAHDFRRIDSTQVNVLLLEGRERVLTTYAPKLSDAARRSLEKRRVQVRTGTLVTGIDHGGVTIEVTAREHGDQKRSERIGARTVLWAAGVQASPLARGLGVPLDRAGRVEVGPDLSIPGHPEVFVIGDLARTISKGKEVPGVAQGALQGGEHAAAIIRAEAAGKAGARPAFEYWDKGSMATIGRASAVVETGRVTISGFLAWLMWWVVHILFLIGFRNRVAVILQWAWSWLTFQRGARLITGAIPPLPAVHDLLPDGTTALPPAASAVGLEAAPPRPRPARDEPALRP